VYLAPYGLWLTLDAGTFKDVEILKNGQVKLGLNAASAFTPTARLHIEQPAKVDGVGKYHPTTNLKQEQDVFDIPLEKKTAWITLSGN